MLPRGLVAGEERTAETGTLELPGREQVLQEVCAGSAGITRAWRKLGLVAEEPIELYEDPERRTGPRADHDLTRAEAQKRSLRAAADKDGPNMWVIAPPCTIYCDFLLWSGGTCTFEYPKGGADGQALTVNEETGNQISEFIAKLFVAVVKAGKFALVERPVRSGRYPNLWDMPEWRAIQEKTNVEIVPESFCAWGLRPVDGSSNEYHRKRTWGLAVRVPGLRDAVARPCPGASPTHVHVAVKGNCPGSRLSRCTEAGRYPEEFC